MSSTRLPESSELRFWEISELRPCCCWKQQQTHKASGRKACAKGKGEQSCNLICSGLGRTAAFGLSIPAQPWGQTPTSCPRAALYPLSSQHPNRSCGCAGSAPSSLTCSLSAAAFKPRELQAWAALVLAEVAVIECYIQPCWGCLGMVTARFCTCSAEAELKTFQQGRSSSGLLWQGKGKYNSHGFCVISRPICVIISNSSCWSSRYSKAILRGLLNFHEASD